MFIGLAWPRGQLYLTPLLLEFARSHPQISLRVAINDNIGDLISAEIDVALKITSQSPEDHVARRICEVGRTSALRCCRATPCGGGSNPEWHAKCWKSARRRVWEIASTC